MPAHKRSIQKIVLCCITFLSAQSIAENSSPDSSQAPEATATTAQPAKKHRINEIIIIGNINTPRDAILNYIPYHIGEIFNAQKSGQLIRNLFSGLKRFRNIELKADFISDDLVNLYIVLEEKPLLKDIIFVGNKNLSEKEMRDKIDFDIAAVDPAELKVFSEQMKKLYFEKGFQNVTIDTDLVIDSDGKSIATFTFHEGSKSRIRRIKFDGNKHIPDKDLRNVLFTREEWIMSIMDRTGSFHPDRLEADKHMIEQYYQNRGFMQAKVIDVKVEQESPEKTDSEPSTEKPKNPVRAKYQARKAARKARIAARSNNILHLTFIVEEGVPYTFSEVKAPGNDIINEEALLSLIPIKPGQPYSREMITDTIKMLEFFWGNLGYIFAHVEPGIQVDDDNKTVSISFISDIGKQIKLNRITIKGNKKTRDKVIRRRVNLREGGILTQGQMENSKNSVSNLGYFEQQDGVNWKIKRINEYEADLDLVVKEAKTGSANVQLSFGGTGVTMNSPASGMVAKFSVADSNAMGTGTAVNAEFTWSKEEKSLLFHLAQPWLFDKPISGAIDVYHKRPSYDQLRNVISAINSKVTGGALTAGFITPPNWFMFNSSQVLFSLGLDSLHYDNPPQPNVSRQLLPPGITEAQANYQYGTILSKEFTPGEYGWFANYLEQDKRNHPMHPSRGQKWKITTKIAFPSLDPRRSGVIGDPIARRVGYAKFFFDYTWFTPLINEHDLIFKLHLFFGLATPIAKATIPFGDLFHIGGDTSVRGFSYGQIGPQFLGDTIGGKKALYLNTELIIPITPDMGMKGVVFYDGGTGWDNPYVCDVNPMLVSNNSFNYRHAVGVGIRMLRPMPVRIDWGFKLDPRPGENASQIHFGMSYDW